MLPLIVVGGLFLWVLSRKEEGSSSEENGDQDVQPDDSTTDSPNEVIALLNNPVRRYAVKYGEPTGSLTGVGAVDLNDAISRARPPQANSDSTEWVISSYWANDATAVQAYSANLDANATVEPEAAATGGRSAKMDKVDVPESDAFEVHKMYDPKTGKAYTAKTIEDHNRMDKLGYTHEEVTVEVVEVESVSSTERNNLFNGGITETRVSDSGLQASRFGGGY